MSISKKISALILVAVIVVVVVPCSSATGFQPYIVGGEGEYAVIDTSSSQVISSGNIFDELLKDATVYAKFGFIAERHYVGASFLDTAHNRLFLFTGQRDGKGGAGYTDGVLALRMSDRKFLNYIKLHSDRWGNDEMFVSLSNNLYFQGGKGMVVYNGVTYVKMPSDITWSYRDGETCFLRDGKRVYDRRYGLYYLDKYVKSQIDGSIVNEVVKNKIKKIESNDAHQVDCRNGRVLLVEEDKPATPGKSNKMLVYDLETDKLLSEFFPEGVEGRSSYYWQLSRDGQYAVWNELVEIKAKNGEPTDVHNGHVLISRAETGKKVSEFQLPKKTKEEMQEYKDYDFKEYSVDNEKMIFYSDSNLYVVDIMKGIVLSKVEVPFMPGWYNSTGFVVWP